MKIDANYKIGFLIWIVICTYGFYLSTSSDDYFLMLQYKEQLELREQYISLCNRSDGHQFSGEVIKIDHVKGGARWLYIQLSEASDSIFLKDLIVANGAFVPQIKSGVLQFRLSGKYEAKHIVVGSEVRKPEDSNVMEFKDPDGWAMVSLFHGYANDFPSCAYAYGMDVVEIYNKYLYHYDLSSEKIELPPTVKANIKRLIHK